MSKPYQPPNKILNEFIYTDYVENPDKVYKENLQKAINKLTVGTTIEIGDNTFVNTNGTNPTTTPNIQCNAPIKLPNLYSNHWTNIPLLGSGIQSMTITATGASTTYQQQFTFYKLGYLVVLMCPEFTFTATANDWLYFNFVSYPEIIPASSITESSITYNNTAPAYQPARRVLNTSGVLRFAKTYIDNTGSYFTSANSYTISAGTLIYIAGSPGY